MSENTLQSSRSILETFREAISALKIYCERLGKHADEYDRQAMTAFSDAFMSLRGIETEELEKLRSRDADEAAGPTKQEQEEIGRRTEEMLKDTSRREAFFAAVKSLKKASPQFTIPRPRQLRLRCSHSRGTGFRASVGTP